MSRVILKRTRSPAVRSKPIAPVGYIAPCQATNLGRAPSGAGWLHEIKHDGFRSQLHVSDGKVVIYSKSGHDWTERYSAVAEQAARLRVRHAVIDGEMVVRRPDGTSDLSALQAHVRGSEASQSLAFFAFDLLFIDGEDVRKLPLVERKERLRKLLGSSSDATKGAGALLYTDHFEFEGSAVWEHAHKVNVEGIVSKRFDAPYRSGRGLDWIKTPCEYRETLVIAGMAFDAGEFEGLYFARRRGAALIYAGKVRAEERYGFTAEVVADLRSRLDPLIMKRQPMATESPKKGARWVQPIFDAHIVHRGGLNVDRVRRPIFEGLVSPDERRAPGSKRSAPAKPHLARSIPANLRENVQRELVDAVVPTRAQLRAYWKEVGKLALPYLANRPLTLVRHVEGVTFFHMGPLPPPAPGVRQIEIVKADGSKGVRLYVDSVKGLLGLVDMGVVEVHPWAATVDDIERPDTMIFDLDPGEGIERGFVIETTLALRALLREEGFDCWPKLTGGSGLHLMVPIERALPHKQVYAYALALARRIEARDPRRYTTQAGASKRVGKLFLDVLRNRRGYTAVGAYSPRARDGLPIAMPTTWREVECDTGISRSITDFGKRRP